MNNLYREYSRQLVFYRIYPFFFIKHSLGLMEQRVWNVMFFFAHDNLLTEEFHKISIATLQNELSVKDQNLICAAVKNLKKSIDCKRNNTELFLDDVQITSNAIIYKYPTSARILCSNKIIHDLYQRMLAVDLSSKYSFALYKYCLHWSLLGYLTIVPIVDLKHYCNVELTRYDNSKIFMDSILIRSIHEINEKTSLTVSLRPIKDGRNITAFNIDVKNKAPFDVTDNDLANFVLHCYAFWKAFFIYNESLEVGKFCVDRYISQADREFFMNKLIPEAKARQRRECV